MTRRRDLAAADLEDLLDGRPTVVAPALATVLGAARTPGAPAELTGLHAAMTAFDARGLQPAGPTAAQGPQPGLVTLFSGWPARIFAGLAASTAVGGVALAAVTGTLPGMEPAPSVPVPSSSPQHPAVAPPHTGGIGGTENPSSAATTPTSPAPAPGPARASGPGVVPGPEVAPGRQGRASEQRSGPDVLPSARPTAPPGDATQPTGPPPGTPQPTHPPQERPSPPPAGAPSAAPAAAASLTSHPTGR